MCSSRRYISTLIICLLLSACSGENDKFSPPDIKTADIQPATNSVTGEGCRSCHDTELDLSHNFECSRCHEGDDTSSQKDMAHTGMVFEPASPEQAEKRCGPCHDSSEDTLKSDHFTSKNMVNLVRRHFGAKKDLATASDIPAKDSPVTPLDLADDLLRRNCLSCHISYSGDDYPSVTRGIGCAACHLEFQNGKMTSHRFIKKPADETCLSCHYGNRVGSDYYGRFEHDFKHEYRTPYQTGGSYPPRPYGIENHKLSVDVHQRAGMACIDCHPGRQLMANSGSISCEKCHLWQKGDTLPGKNLEAKNNNLVLITALKARSLPVPSANDKLHRKYLSIADCQVCHAQWSYNDQSTYLLRLDVDEYDEWDDLVVQSGSEVEILLSNSLYGDESYAPSMTDKITGHRSTGIWLKGYDIRRWEKPLIRKDLNGRFRIVRPLLDLVLSWVNSDEETVFDSVRGSNNIYLPYTPHTTGPAGAFYRSRLVDMTRKDTPEKESEK